MIQRTAVDHCKRAIKSLVPTRYQAWGDLVYARMTAPLYYGNKVECLVCGGHFSKFLPWYSGPKPIRCPRCRSMPRHRLLMLYFRDKTDLFTAPHRLLHIAPEERIQALFKRIKTMEYLSADLQSPFAMRHFDLTKSPLPDKSFTAILCNHVLEHIPDDRAAMREIFRMLEPGGWAMVMVPTVSSGPTQEDVTLTDPAERERRFAQADHFRLYGDDYHDRLREIGFEVVEDHHAASLSPEDAARYGIDRAEVITLAIRPKA